MNVLNENINFLLKRNGYSAKELSASLKLSFKLDKPGEGNQPLADDLIKLSDHFGFSVDLLLKRRLKLMEEVSAKNIQFLVLDVDGVMTDRGMYYTESGDEFKRFDTLDGVAVRRLTRNGFKVGIISSGFLIKLIQNRADLLGIQYVQTGSDPKIKTMERWSKELNIDFKHIAFIGDDLNDKAVMERVGVSACPADAEEEIKKIASVVLTKKGGRGCIREFVDHYFTNNPFIKKE